MNMPQELIVTETVANQYATRMRYLASSQNNDQLSQRKVWERGSLAIIRGNGGGAAAASLRGGEHKKKQRAQG